MCSMSIWYYGWLQYLRRHSMKHFRCLLERLYIGKLRPALNTAWCFPLVKYSIATHGTPPRDIWTEGPCSKESSNLGLSALKNAAPVLASCVCELIFDHCWHPLRRVFFPKSANNDHCTYTHSMRMLFEILASSD